MPINPGSIQAFRERPADHLENFKGDLQADAQAGYDRLHEDGTIFEARCRAHVRREIFCGQEATDSPVAAEALERPLERIVPL